MSVVVRCGDCKKKYFEGKTSEIDAEYTGLICEKCAYIKALTALEGVSLEVESYWEEAIGEGENMYDWVQTVIGDAIVGIRGPRARKIKLDPCDVPMEHRKECRKNTGVKTCDECIAKLIPITKGE